MVFDFGLQFLRCRKQKFVFGGKELFVAFQDGVTGNVLARFRTEHNTDGRLCPSPRFSSSNIRLGSQCLPNCKILKFNVKLAEAFEIGDRISLPELLGQCL